MIRKTFASVVSLYDCVKDLGKMGGIDMGNSAETPLLIGDNTASGQLFRAYT